MILIMQDADPELDEVFVVQLTSVTLLGGATGTVPPTVGVASVAEVTILSNDSPRGTLTFLQESYTVQEDVGSVDIVIAREQGTIGQVSVVYFVTSVQAMNGQDFVVEPVDAVVFAPGQANFTLSIPIMDDSLPEIEEDFCVGLRLPRDGAILGNVTASKLSPHIIIISLPTMLHNYYRKCIAGIGFCRDTYSSLYCSCCIAISTC